MTYRGPLTDTQDAALRDAIAAAAEGAIVTKYVVLAETVDPATGERMIEDFAPDDVTVWDGLGMLEFTAASWREAVAAGVRDDQ